MRKIICIFILMVLVPTASQAAGIRVLVSIPPAAWFVRQVAGDLAEVQVMIPAGASPHAYEPKPRQMTAVARADLYLAIGGEFEDSWLPRFRGVNPELVVHRLDAGIVKLPMTEHGHGEGEAHGGDHGKQPTKRPTGHEGKSHVQVHQEVLEPHQGLDPHIWLSPRLATIIVDNVREAMSEADPMHAAQYAANTERVLATIASLQRELAPLFRDLPSNRFLVFHPSWGYFAREFGLGQIPIEVQGREPSPRELHDLVQEALEHGVRAVFVQPQMSRRTAQIVADELDGRVVLADPLAEDWDANLRRVARELAAAMKEER
ncbi:metal ABC transporter solute-binding protein, Zn/Mn family [Desulfovibrio ferrophilus]|uniref:ABC-type metal ion transport system, periplasmic component/surface adhesin n=1 Tax=Desulfovibrio ferrophilus TaxID=241368 RepID=A0A2Z6AZT5_9BACT|nr:zinc ABC transporter substrate-binding protein [Desulfovibrio ferrophilus]BBD08695.1 ABC-type metal ion transport system, periplasmic component/surface adhesin [Desulfovibrio ferrophilus]